MDKSEKRFAIDRIEEGIAVCEELATQRVLRIPVAFVPIGAVEGDIIVRRNGEYAIDYEQTNTKKAVLLERLKKLRGNKA